MFRSRGKHGALPGIEQRIILHRDHRRLNRVYG